MKKELGTFVAGVALAGAVVGGAVVGGAMAFDTDAPTKSAGWADPAPCVQAAGGELDCGSPVASPIAPTVTAEPTATATVEPTATVFIDTLPATGTGPQR